MIDDDYYRICLVIQSKAFVFTNNICNNNKLAWVTEWVGYQNDFMQGLCLLVIIRSPVWWEVVGRIRIIRPPTQPSQVSRLTDKNTYYICPQMSVVRVGAMGHTLQLTECRIICYIVLLLLLLVTVASPSVLLVVVAVILVFSSFFLSFFVVVVVVSSFLFTFQFISILAYIRFGARCLLVSPDTVVDQWKHTKERKRCSTVCSDEWELPFVMTGVFFVGKARIEREFIYRWNQTIVFTGYSDIVRCRASQLLVHI